VRYSYIIGAVFEEIVPAALPIIHHREKETVPIILLFGTVHRHFLGKQCDSS
jgi:hypothetical protein